MTIQPVYNFFLQHQILTSCIGYLLTVVPLLLSIAFFTVYERHMLAALQRRQGPNVVGIFGILQPLADGMKLFLKETIFPKTANHAIFVMAPILSFGLSLCGWLVLPITAGTSAISDLRLGLLFLFALSSLAVHTIIMAGWSSNSKYAFLGGLRSASQILAYEVSMGCTLLPVLTFSGSMNLANVMEAQTMQFGDGSYSNWFILPLFPVLILYFITAVAETNKHPFDLPEAEAELVSGYNVEYTGIGFALFFLGESSNVILMSALCSAFFLGGFGSPFISLVPLFTEGLEWMGLPLSVADSVSDFVFGHSVVWFGIKTLFFMSWFILLRGALPRYRYDQLMRLGWKVFLPFSLASFIFYASVVMGFNGFSELPR